MKFKNAKSSQPSVVNLRAKQTKKKQTNYTLVVANYCYDCVCVCQRESIAGFVVLMNHILYSVACSCLHSSHNAFISQPQHKVLTKTQVKP